MKFARTYSAPGEPYAGVAFEPRTSRIVNPNGSMIFEAKDIQIPADWSQVATDIIAQKYFRKAGVPSALKGVEEPDIPRVAVALRARRRRDLRARDRRPSGLPSPGRHAGPTGAISTATSIPRATRARTTTRCARMLARQIGAPNSPQWFNTGLHWAYGIAGPAQGHYFVDPKTGELTESHQRLRAPGSPRLLHPIRQRRSGQRRRHHGPVGSRSAHLQVRQRHRFEFLDAARRGRKALRRRHEFGPHVVPARRRSRRRRDQDRAVPRAARPRWSCSTSIIPTSKNSSAGKSREEQKVADLVTGSIVVREASQR